MTQTTRKEMTDRWLRTLEVPATRLEFSDTRQTGLRLRLSPEGSKIFLLRARGLDGRNHAITLGHYPSLSLKEARERAAAQRQLIKDGQDPNATKRAARERADGESVTLAELLDEFEVFRSPMREIWCKSPKGRCEARRRIDSVFGKLTGRRMSELTDDDFAACMMGHKPARENGKRTANGQVSRARAYLAPVLNWAAHRKPFHKKGAGRSGRIETPDLSLTHDPADDDPTITGIRKRALHQDELTAILPLLVYPAPAVLKMKTLPEDDYRPIALRFQLLTAARIDEIASMRWCHLAKNQRIWHKPEVKTIGGKAQREQHLSLSEAAMELLQALPGFHDSDPNDYVFPNSVGGKLGNWGRITKAIQRKSATADWHRHDLRRTAASIMKALGESDSAIDGILGHKASDREENVSASLKHYIAVQQILVDPPSPQRDALDRLAKILSLMQPED